MSLVKVSQYISADGRIHVTVANSSGKQSCNEPPCSVIFSLRASHPHFFFCKKDNDESNSDHGGGGGGSITHSNSNNINPPLGGVHSSTGAEHLLRTSNAMWEAHGIPAAKNDDDDERPLLVPEVMPDDVLLPGGYRSYVLECEDANYVMGILKNREEAVSRRQQNQSRYSGGDSSVHGREYTLAFEPSTVKEHNNNNNNNNNKQRNKNGPLTPLSISREEHDNNDMTSSSPPHSSTSRDDSTSASRDCPPPGGVSRNQKKTQQQQQRSGGNTTPPILYVCYRRLGNESECVESARQWLRKESQKYLDWQVEYMSTIAKVEAKKRKMMDSHHAINVNHNNNNNINDINTANGLHRGGGCSAAHTSRRIMPPVLGESIRWQDDKRMAADSAPPFGSFCGNKSFISTAFLRFYGGHSGNGSLFSENTSSGSSSAATAAGRDQQHAWARIAKHEPRAFEACHTNVKSKQAQKMFLPERVGGGTVVLPIRNRLLPDDSNSNYFINSHSYSNMNQSVGQYPPHAAPPPPPIVVNNSSPPSQPIAANASNSNNTLNKSKGNNAQAGKGLALLDDNNSNAYLSIPRRQQTDGRDERSSTATTFNQNYNNRTATTSSSTNNNNNTLVDSREPSMNSGLPLPTGAGGIGRTYTLDPTSAEEMSRERQHIQSAMRGSAAGEPSPVPLRPSDSVITDPIVVMEDSASGFNNTTNTKLSSSGGMKEFNDGLPSFASTDHMDNQQSNNRRAASPTFSNTYNTANDESFVNTSLVKLNHMLAYWIPLHAGEDGCLVDGSPDDSIVDLSRSYPPASASAAAAASSPFRRARPLTTAVTRKCLLTRSGLPCVVESILTRLAEAARFGIEAASPYTEKAVGLVMDHTPGALNATYSFANDVVLTPANVEVLHSVTMPVLLCVCVWVLYNVLVLGAAGGNGGSSGPIRMVQRDGLLL